MNLRPLSISTPIMGTKKQLAIDSDAVPVFFSSGKKHQPKGCSHEARKARCNHDPGFDIHRLNDDVKIPALAQVFLRLDATARHLLADWRHRVELKMRQSQGFVNDTQAMKQVLSHPSVSISPSWLVKSLAEASGRQKLIPRTMTQAITALDRDPNAVQQDVDFHERREHPFFFPGTMGFRIRFPRLLGLSPDQLLALGTRTDTEVSTSLRPNVRKTPNEPQTFLHRFKLVIPAGREENGFTLYKQTPLDSRYLPSGRALFELVIQSPEQSPKI